MWSVNQVAHVKTYPLLRIEDLFVFAGGQTFSKLDLFLQLEVDDESNKYLTINTSKGLFQYNRMPFGVASAPSIRWTVFSSKGLRESGISVMIF